MYKHGNDYPSEFYSNLKCINSHLSDFRDLGHYEVSQGLTGNGQNFYSNRTSEA